MTPQPSDLDEARHLGAGPSHRVQAPKVLVSDPPGAGGVGIRDARAENFRSQTTNVSIESGRYENHSTVLNDLALKFSVRPEQFSTHGAQADLLVQ
jgi:hypothetical protein